MEDTSRLDMSSLCDMSGFLFFLFFLFFLSLLSRVYVDCSFTVYGLDRDVAFTADLG